MNPQVMDGVAKLMEESESISTGFGGVLWGILIVAVVAVGVAVWGALSASASQSREEEWLAARRERETRAARRNSPRVLDLTRRPLLEEGMKPFDERK